MNHFEKLRLLRLLGMLNASDDGAAGGGADPQGGKSPDPAAQPETEDKTDWKAMARKWEDQAKANKGAADELEKLKDAQKSAEQKLTDENSSLKERLAGFEAKEQQAAWAADIAKDSHVDASLIKGSTREEMETHFKQLEASIPKPESKKGAVGPYVKDEGKTPTGSTTTETTPGRGTLRAAYAEAETK